MIAAAASDGYAATLAGVASWVSAKFYGGAPINNTPLCLASVSCDFRLADSFGSVTHARIFPSGVTYTFSSTSDSYAGSSAFGIGVLAFKPTPEPSLILPLGAGLMMMGYMVYRRRKD